MSKNQQLASLKDLADIQISSNASKLETALRISQYAHCAFAHNGDNQPSHSDPLTILKESKQGAEFRCVEYSHLAAWLMMAHGITSRTVNIMTKDVESAEYGAGHVVVEFYSGELHGWVMADIQAGTVTRYKGKLQSVLELRETIDDAVTEDFSGKPFAAPSNMFGGDYKQWLRPYLHFIDRSQELNFEYSVDTKPHYILIPKGDTPPKYFQRDHKLDLIVATPELFYETK